MEQNQVVKSVLPKFETDLSDKQLEQITTVAEILDANQVTGFVRDRTVARYKAFMGELVVTGKDLFKPQQE